ncbi:hypothetical protein D3C72_1323490 [compost metagenome]
MIGRAHGLAVDLRIEHREHLALQVGLDQEGAELLADPQRAAGELEALGIEVRTRQVALLRAFVNDAERHLLVGVVQEDGVDAIELAALEVHLVVVQVEHEVGRVGLRAGAVVGEDPERAVVHLLDARVPLQRLALEGHRHAGATAGREAFDRAQRLDALARGELAADLQVGRRVFRGGDEALRRQHGVAGERGGEGGLGHSATAGEGGGQGDQREGSEARHERKSFQSKTRDLAGQA